MFSFSKTFKSQQISQIILLILLLILLITGAVPGYLTGKWQWIQPPKISQIHELRNIRKVGLSIPGWETIQQSETQVGEHKWSLQVLKEQDSTDESEEAILLLLPQADIRDQPAVEWTDISGWAKFRWGAWDMAQYRDVEFTVDNDSAQDKNLTSKVQARFFRATTKKETFAVLQWYAMSNGGTASVLKWFAADQLAQWQKKRIPWVAVSIMIPIESFGQAETSLPQLESLGKKVQSTLISKIL
ncbi:MAG: cyanoexosortase B system-associated protein [Nostocales cyanobacterium]|nr:MAG: cyanoexosortase B system-associated protein [Nostocales cyanobacterium]TAF13207.1 MAG: cyanoexosortase B system-associated protein [Nostocales cyanobacterium]